MTKSNSANLQPLNFSTWLTQRNDPQLLEILHNRPDSTYPLPPGIGSLAARLKLRTSIRRAIQGLTASDIATLEATAMAGGELQPVTYPELAEYIGAVLPDEVLRASINTLIQHALIFGTHQQFQIAPEVMAALPQQWSLIENTHYDLDEVSAVLDTITTQQRQILDTLAHSGGTGVSKDAAPDADPNRPVSQLIALKLLQRVDTTTVRLPTIVRSVLLAKPAPVIPIAPPKPTNRPPEDVEKLATANALEAVRLVRSFLEHAGHTPVSLLKDGAVGVRAQASLKAALNCDDLTVLRVIAVVIAARLVDRGLPEDGEDIVLAPTMLAEEYLKSPLANQWAELIHGWWHQADFAPWLVTKSVRALSRDSIITQLPLSRQMILQHCTRPLDQHELSQLVHYYAPLAAGTHDVNLITEITKEACWLGVLVAKDSVLYPAAALTPLIAGGDITTITEVTQNYSPSVVDKLIPQGDMTLLAPGPLIHEIQMEISLLADVESPGLASVYRLSETSVRRAFDAGRTAEDITAFLSSHVLGDVPQTMSFLVNDIARKHGQLRGGPAMSYIRCDDETLLIELSRSPVAQEVGLRLLAPNVAISQTPLAQVFQAVKAAGFHPVAENSEGLSIDMRPKPVRVATPDAQLPKTKTPNAEHFQAALAALRGGPAVPLTPCETKLSPSTVIQSAIRSKQAVRLGFVDASGSENTIELTPIAVTGGQLSAIDHTTGQLHQLSLHRLTEAVIVNP